MGFSKSSTKSEFYNNTILSQEIRKISNKIPNLTHKAIRERRTGCNKHERATEKCKITEQQYFFTHKTVKGQEKTDRI